MAAEDFHLDVTGRGLAFHAVPVRMDDLVASEHGRDWLGHSEDRPLVELRRMTRTFEALAEPLGRELARLAGTFDVVLSGIATADAADALVEAGGGRHVIALLAPFRPTRAGSAGVQAPVPHGDSWRNLVAGQSMNWFLAGAFGGPGRVVRRELGLPGTGRRHFTRVLRDSPTLLGVSRQVLPRPDDWPRTQEITGYWFLPAPEAWSPDPELADFLAAGDPPVYVGFGSMSTHDPEGTLATIVAALERSGRRGVIHRGGAGLSAGEVPETVRLVDQVPHDWLFPRCAGVVHHGGAGTTAAGLRAGVPSLVVPHIGDQSYWGRRVNELGAGPQPIRRHELTIERLATAIGELVTSRAMAERARSLGDRIRAENGVAVAVDALPRLGTR